MSARSFTTDVLKTLAAQIIFWHHWSSYTPMADRVAVAYAPVVDFLFDDGRMAVVVFMVCAGYVSAHSLMQRPVVHHWQALGRRLLRLWPLYILALMVTVAVGAWLRGSLPEDALPEPLSSWGQLLAHLVLLQGVTGQPSLAVGVWYVSIDMQLFAMLLLVTLLAKHPSAHEHVYRVQIWTGLGVLLSAWFFNRNPEYEEVGPYFFAAYGLGVLSATVGESRRAWLRWLLVCAGVGFAWMWDGRERLVLALATSLVLSGWPALRVAAQGTGIFFQRTGDASYAFFLFHYPLLLLSCALWNIWPVQTVGMAIAFSLVVWLTVGGLSLLIHQRVETPIQQWLR